MLLEVALCIMAYIVVLWIELSPAFLEHVAEPRPTRGSGGGRGAAADRQAAAARAIIALGLLLPTMHQSSLGTLMLLAGSRLHPLWNTPLLPLLFLISCVVDGLRGRRRSESAFSSVAFKRKPDMTMLAGLAAPMVPDART